MSFQDIIRIAETMQKEARQATALHREALFNAKIKISRIPEKLPSDSPAWIRDELQHIMDYLEDVLNASLKTERK